MTNKLSEGIRPILGTENAQKSGEVCFIQKEPFDLRGRQESDTCRRFVTVDRASLQITLINQNSEEKRFSSVSNPNMNTCRCLGTSTRRARRRRPRRSGRCRSLHRHRQCRPTFLPSRPRRTPTKSVSFSEVGAAFSACDIFVTADSSDTVPLPVPAARLDSMCDSDNGGNRLSSKLISQEDRSGGKDSISSQPFVGESSPTPGTTVSHMCEKQKMPSAFSDYDDDPSQTTSSKSDGEQGSDFQNCCDIVKVYNHIYFPDFKQSDTENEMKITETDGLLCAFDKEGYMFMAEDFFQVWGEAKELGLDFPLALSMPSSMNLVKISNMKGWNQESVYKQMDHCLISFITDCLCPSKRSTRTLPVAHNYLCPVKEHG